MAIRMIMNVIIVSLAGGILCLDRVVLQAMICRPIVTAPVIGLLLGDAYTGLIAGAFVELFWIDRLPMGGYLPPNETVAAILISAGVILSAELIGILPSGLIALAVLLFLPLGIAAQKLECHLSRNNEAVMHEAMRAAERGDTGAIARKHLQAILRYYLLSAGLILFFLPLGVAVLTWGYPRLTGFMVRGLEILYGILPLLGCAVALHTITIRGAVPLFCAVFLAATVGIAFYRGL
jgi:PTS system mannose-specific IIC component